MEERDCSFSTFFFSNIFVYNYSTVEWITPVSASVSIPSSLMHKYQADICHYQIPVARAKCEPNRTVMHGLQANVSDIKQVFWIEVTVTLSVQMLN